MHPSLAVLWKDVVRPVQVGEVTLYVRVMSDPMRLERDTFALNAMRVLRRALHDEGSPEWRLYVGPVLDGTRDELIQAIKGHELRRITREALDIEPEYVPQPPTEEHPGVAERLEVEEAREANVETAKDRRQQFIDQALADLEGELGVLDDGDLYERAKEAVTDLVTERHHAVVAAEASILIATYVDAEGKQRAFSSIEEVRQMHPRAQEALMAAIIESESVDPFRPQDPGLGRATDQPGNESAGPGATPEPPDDCPEPAVVPEPGADLPAKGRRRLRAVGDGAGQ